MHIAICHTKNDIMIFQIRINEIPDLLKLCMCAKRVVYTYIHVLLLDIDMCTSLNVA